MIGFLFDLEGTLVKDKTYTPFEDALRLLEKLDKLGIAWVIASNNSTEPPSDLLNVLRQKGFKSLDGSRLITPSVIALEVLKSKGVRRLYLLGNEKMKRFFKEQGFDVTDDADVEAVLVARDKNLTYDKLKIAVSAVALNGAELFTYHMNRLIKDPDGLVGPSVGAVAKSISYATNKEPIAFGKPQKSYFEKAMSLLNLNDPERVFMVSDDPFSDLAKGKENVGFKTIFVLCGKYKSADVLNQIEPPLRPDYVFDSVKGIENLLGDFL